jgi:uncharacterized protein
MKRLLQIQILLIIISLNILDISAQFSLQNNPIKPKASPFRLSEVNLLDSPFKHAMQLDAEVLLKISPDRLLHNFRKNAGLEPKGKIYGGWESREIAGHTLGHFWLV